MNTVFVPRRSPWRADLLDSGRRLAADVLLRPDTAVAGRLDAQPRRQRVDDRHAHAVQAAGDLVAATTELAARVEDGVHDLEGVLARRMASHRHAAAVVLDGHLAVVMDRHDDRRREAGHGLVDRVVDDLPHQVVQAALIGRPDVHPGASTDGLETLEDLDAGGGVVGPCGLRLAGGGGPAVRCRGPLPIADVRHAVPPMRRS